MRGMSRRSWGFQSMGATLLHIWKGPCFFGWSLGFAPGLAQAGSCLVGLSGFLSSIGNLLIRRS